jgi:hypothetical protein
VTHPLLARLRSADAGERCAACRGAAEDPAAVLLTGALSEALGDPVRAVSQAAGDALAAIGRSHDVRPELRAALHSAESARRLAAALTWARLEPPDPRLLPALVDALALADSKRRWAAARLLVETGRLHGEVLPLLLGLSQGHEDAVVRRMARYCLRELAPDEAEVARALLAGTGDSDMRARRAAYTALASLLDPPAAVLQYLVKALAEEPDAASRRIATVALAQLAPSQREALRESAAAALRRASAETGDPDLRRGAERALARIAAAARIGG